MRKLLVTLMALLAVVVMVAAVPSNSQAYYHGYGYSSGCHYGCAGYWPYYGYGYSSGYGHRGIGFHGGPLEPLAPIFRGFRAGAGFYGGSFGFGGGYGY